MRTKLVLCAALAAIITAGCRVVQEVEVEWPAGTFVDTTSSGCPVGLIMASTITPANGSITAPVGTHIKFDGTVQVPSGCASGAFDWTTSDVNVVTIDASGNAVIVGPGTAQVCMVLREDTSVKTCITVVGTATTTCVVTGVNVTGTTNPLTLGGTVDLAATVTSNPAGCATRGVTWSTSNVSIATVSSSGRVTGVSPGTVTITATSVDDPTKSGTFTITVVATTTPTVSIGTLVNMSMGTNCAATQPLSVTVANIQNPVITVTSSNNAVATVSGSGTSWTVTRAGAGTVTFTASVTGTNQSTPVTFTTPAITIGTAPCSGAGTFTFNPASVCFSRVSGSSTTATVTVTAADMPAGTVINVSSSDASLVSVSPSSFTFPTGTITLTLASGTAVGNVNLTFSGNGATGAIPVQVVSGACPGTGQTIDYTPGGGTVTSGSTPPTLNAVCTANGATVTCPNQPFWTSDHPEILSVKGSTQNSQGFWVGNTATLTRISSGGSTVVQICVQWSVTQTSPRQCHGWQVP